MYELYLQKAEFYKEKEVDPALSDAYFTCARILRGKDRENLEEIIKFETEQWKQRWPYDKEYYKKYNREKVYRHFVSVSHYQLKPLPDIESLINEANKPEGRSKESLS